MTPDVEQFADLQAQFDAGRYDAVVTFLTERPPATPEEWRLLGMAYQGSGRFQQAELPLMRAMEQGDEEARVEYGNVLRLLGRFSEAIRHFAAITPGLTGELALRAQRWWGTAEFQSGRMAEGMERCERAWRGYMALGDDERIGRVTQTVAQMLVQTGEVLRAQHLYQEALRLLPTDRTPIARLSALTGLANVQVLTGDFKGAKQTIDEARELLTQTDALTPKAYLLAVEAVLHHLTRDHAAHLQTLQALRGIVERTRHSQDFELLTWTATRMADLHSRQGQHARALEVLLDLAPDATHPAVTMTRGILLRRRQHHAQAAEHLARALESQTLGEGQRIRALLHLAEAQAALGGAEQSLRTFREALTALIAARDRMLYRPDLHELANLVQRALLHPDLASDTQLVLDKLNVPGSEVPVSGSLHLRVYTLGRSEIEREGETITLSLEGGVLTLVYLALHPGRTRRELEATLYPDRDPKTAGDYFRAVFRELRVRLGAEVIRMEGSAKQPRYSLGPDVHVHLDVTELRAALAAGDLAGALALYRGPFLAGLRMESEWAEEVREELRLLLTMELRSRIAQAREAGDLRRALLLINELLRVDPFDLSMLEARVALAREVASPPELARYVVELHRMKP
ncbi:SARP family transcriptional regulator [Deinococcus sp. RL]|uniref:SARP family transcriptional regulator n=1 Tax=Deinococcus sp. RL TaxID=1489678 RepID=UPI0004D47E80|nr:SARP family transcriptional regulator [Deinococcus sp. RL]KEF33426.1 SARP family transcriptional regulator [Deinococcus sp. RL]